VMRFCASIIARRAPLDGNFMTTGRERALARWADHDASIIYALPRQRR